MTKPDRKEPAKSERAEAHEKMLEEALAPPRRPHHDGSLWLLAREGPRPRRLAGSDEQI